MKNSSKKLSLSDMASGKLLNKYILKFMDKYIEKKNKEDTLLDQFGVMWFYIFFGIGSFLFLAGAWADGMVLYGMFYDLTVSVWKSAVVAIGGSLFIQVVIGVTLFLIVYNLMAKNDTKEGFAYMVGLCVILVVVGLGSSLYLSNHSEEIANAIAVPPLLKDTVAMEQENKFAIAKLDRDQRLENQQLTANHDEVIAGLQNELVAFDQGVIQSVKAYELVNDKASVAYVLNKSPDKRKSILAKITSAKQKKNTAIAALLQKNKLEKKALTQKLSNQLNTARLQNTNLKKGHQEKVIKRGNFLKFTNIAINLLRVILCIMFGMFVFYVLKERGHITPTSPPNPKKKKRLWTFSKNGNTADSTQRSPLEIQGVIAEWGDGGQFITIKEITDLSGAKQALRNSHKRRITSAEIETREEHEMKAQALMEYFEDYNIYFRLTSDTGLSYTPVAASA